jgi:serine/threonine protein kinase
MSTVYRARDRELDREVALKVMGPGPAGDGTVARLRNEARVLARLEHPGLVPVHDIGTLPDGRLFYVMRLVRGRRLDDHARQERSLAALLRLFERVCEAVAFAHAQGVLHRDLKPANVMVGPFGEVLVLDWGVARERGVAEPSVAPAPVPDETMTAHGTVLGTPGYMSPEQAAGLPADHRSDIYGLGAILRDLLEARREPVPKALAAIRDRALAHDPGGRYADALAFRDDLGRFQDGARVAAYRETPLDVALRFGRQYRTPILLVLAYLVMRMAILWWRGI